MIVWSADGETGPPAIRYVSVDTSPGWELRMPPRLFVALILVFWASTTSWLFYREIWPRLRAGEAPPFSIDLTDEVGANVISWKVQQKGTHIGDGISWVKRLPDRTFELNSELKFLRFDLFLFRVRKVAWAYRVTPEGKLVGLTGKVRFRARGDEDPRLFQDEEISVKAPVKEGQLEPTLYLNERPIYEAEPFQLSHTGSVLNPMGMVNKIEGLKDGQSWTVPLLDAMPVGLPGKDLLVPQVYAHVSTDFLHWPIDQPVVCFRIDYSKPGEGNIATTWVRRRDNVVLKQEARLHGIDIALIRGNI